MFSSGVELIAYALALEIDENCMVENWFWRKTRMFLMGFLTPLRSLIDLGNKQIGYGI